MPGQLESAIVEIRRVYDVYLSLKIINPNLPPDCVVECLEQFFGNRSRNRSRSMLSIIANTREGSNRKLMKNLQTAYKAYRELLIVCPKSSPDTLTKTLNAILKPSNLVKAEFKTETDYTESFSTSFVQEDESRADGPDSSIEMVDVTKMPNSTDSDSNDDRDATNNSDSDGRDISWMTIGRNVEESRRSFPLTSTPAFRILRQPRRKLNIDWAQLTPIPRPSQTPTRTCTQNDNRTQSQVTPNTEKRRKYKCNFGCKKTFKTRAGKYFHARLHTRIGLLDCDNCDRKFTTRQNFVKHQRGCNNSTKPDPRDRLRCEFCSRVFPNLKILETHRRMENLKCRYPPCTKQFCYKSNLVVHERKHQRENSLYT